MRKRRPYTMSARALAQRRGAAWKTGEHAASAVRQTLPPCRPGTCPLGHSAYPCSIRLAMDQRDLALEACPLPVVTDPKVKEDIAQAIRAGDPLGEGVVELAALNIASLHGLARRGFDAIDTFGVLVKDHMLSKEGESLGFKVKANPAIEPTLKAVELLGHTGREQAITPKSRGEKKRDEGLGSLAEFLADKRKALEEPPSP